MAPCDRRTRSTRFGFAPRNAVPFPDSPVLRTGFWEPSSRSSLLRSWLAASPPLALWVRRSCYMHGDVPSQLHGILSRSSQGSGPVRSWCRWPVAQVGSTFRLIGLTSGLRTRFLPGRTAVPRTVGQPQLAGIVSEWLKFTGQICLILFSELYNQTVWPVNFGITGPICARASFCSG